MSITGGRVRVSTSLHRRDNSSLPLLIALGVLFVLEALGMEASRLAAPAYAAG